MTTLRTHVDSSGFPLQLAIAHYVQSGGTGWGVLYEEHAWQNGDDSGFIDLVLEDQYKTWLMNIECKRVRDSDWIFLRKSGSSPTRRNVKLWVSRFAQDAGMLFYDWVDIPMDPDSVESAYCVVPGQDPKSRPMLERTAATVVLSTEALANQETGSLSTRYSDLRIYQNVIVTTATLHVCDVVDAEIDLETGQLGDGSAFREVPYVRFRKQLGARSREVPRATDPAMLRQNLKHKESTVFVVNSLHFAAFLSACELPDNFERYINAR